MSPVESYSKSITLWEQSTTQVSHSIEFFVLIWHHGLHIFEMVNKDNNDKNAYIYSCSDIIDCIVNFVQSRQFNFKKWASTSSTNSISLHGHRFWATKGFVSLSLKYDPCCHKCKIDNGKPHIITNFFHPVHDYWRRRSGNPYNITLAMRRLNELMCVLNRKLSDERIAAYISFLTTPTPCFSCSAT